MYILHVARHTAIVRANDYNMILGNTDRGNAIVGTALCLLIGHRPPLGELVVRQRIPHILAPAGRQRSVTCISNILCEDIAIRVAARRQIGAYDITADELLAGTDTAKTESKTAQAQMLILELLADGKRMPSAELEKAVNERGISSRTMRTAKSRIGDRLVTEKDGTAWVCYLRD